MYAFRTILLAASALTTQSALAADTPPPGPFTTPTVTFSGNTGPLTQTPAPDNSALSLLFQGLKVEQQAGGNRSDANHLALRIPLMVGGTAKLKAELRGSIAADKGVECRISLDGPDGLTVLMARNMPQAYMKTYIPVSASDGEPEAHDRPALHRQIREQAVVCYKLDLLLVISSFVPFQNIHAGGFEPILSKFSRSDGI